MKQKKITVYLMSLQSKNHQLVTMPDFSGYHSAKEYYKTIFLAVETEMLVKLSLLYSVYHYKSLN